MEPSAPIEFNKSQWESPTKKVKHSAASIISFRQITSDHVPFGSVIRFRVTATKAKEFPDRRTGAQKWVVYGVAFDVTMCPMQFSAFGRAGDLIRNNGASATVFESTDFLLDLTPTTSKAHKYKLTLNTLYAVSETIPSPNGPFRTFADVFPHREEEVEFNFTAVVIEQHGLKYAYTFMVSDKTVKNAHLKFTDNYAGCLELARQQPPFVMVVHNATKTLTADIYVTNRSIVEFNPDTPAARQLVNMFRAGPLRPCTLAETPCEPPPAVDTPVSTASHTVGDTSMVQPAPAHVPQHTQHAACPSDKDEEDVPLQNPKVSAPSSDDTAGAPKRRASKNSGK